MGWRDLFTGRRTKARRATVGAAALMSTNPIVVEPLADQRVRQMAYRLGSIRTYINERAAEGRTIEPGKLAHLQAEAETLEASLRQEGVEV